MVDAPRKPLIDALVSTASLVVIIAGIHLAREILVPFLLSVFIAIVSAPPFFWMRRRGIPTAIAIVVVIGAVLAMALFFLALVGSSLNSFITSLPIYQQRLQQEIRSLLGWLDGLGIEISNETLMNYIDPGAAMGLVSTVLSAMVGVLNNGLFMAFIITFLLLEASDFEYKLQQILGRPETGLRFERFKETVNRYLVLKTLMSAVDGVLVALLATIVGLDFALLWGVLAFFFNYIPNIGSIIAAVPAILLAFVQLGVWGALLTIGGYFVINNVITNIIEARLIGHELGLSTLVVLLSLIFWGWVLGPVGMFLSVPLTMTIKIACDNYEQTRWLAVLLGTRPLIRKERHRRSLTQRV